MHACMGETIVIAIGFNSEVLFQFFQHLINFDSNIFDVPKILSDI